MRKKRSPVYKLSPNDFKKLLSESRTYSDVCRSFNISNRGGNIATIKRRVKEERLESFVSHFEKGSIDARRKKLLDKNTAIEIYFIKDKIVCGETLKRYIKHFNLLEEKCECGLTNCWQDKKLVLQIDHIDGDRKNNCLENLRFLCPNCHSQTHNFAGRKPKKPYVEWRNNPRYKTRRVIRPSKNELSQLIQNKSFTEIAKSYDISDNAVRKWCKTYGLI